MLRKCHVYEQVREYATDRGNAEALAKSWSAKHLSTSPLKMAIIPNTYEAAWWSSSSHLGRLALFSIGIFRALENVAEDCLRHIFGWRYLVDNTLFISF